MVNIRSKKVEWGSDWKSNEVPLRSVLCTCSLVIYFSHVNIGGLVRRFVDDIGDDVAREEDYQRLQQDIETQETARCWNLVQNI